MRLAPRRQLFAILAFVLVVRLSTLGMYPLTDTTEARYGEIARKMLETGQWIVPQFDYGIPFWGKPPLSFWLTAISYKLLGVTEFAARIPSLLIGVAVCALTFLLASSRNGTDHGLRASVVLATTLLMMVGAGGVMTDPAMTFGTALSMTAFWFGLAKRNRLWGYLFFVGLAIGLLAKGPVASVLTLGPVGLWAIATGRVREAWTRLPWMAGLMLAALLVVPWYGAAELTTPGFLNYFLVGEHWLRFTVRGWKGDLYGASHAETPGTIWLYAALATLPWSAWLAWQWVRRGAAIRWRPARGGDGWLAYLLCWTLMPVVFFTFARNILPTYVMPGLVGFALLVAEAVRQRRPRGPDYPFLLTSLATPAFALLLVFFVWPQAGYKSQKELVLAYQGRLQADHPLIYYKLRTYSAQFYSQGRARNLQSEIELRRHLSSASPAYLATSDSAYAALPPDLRSGLKQIASSRSGEYVLLQAIGAVPLRGTRDAAPGPERRAASTPLLGGAP